MQGHQEYKQVFNLKMLTQISHPTFFSHFVSLHMRLSVRMNEWIYICALQHQIPTIPYSIHSSIHSLYSLLYQSCTCECVYVSVCCVHDLLLSLDENYYGNRSLMILSLNTMRLHVNAMASEEGQNSNSNRLLLLVVRYVVRMYACVCVRVYVCALFISQLLHTHARTQAKEHSFFR